MKQKRSRIVSSILLASALFLNLSFSALAANRTEYVNMFLPEGANQTLQFETNSKTLFTFDNAVPGDVLTQYITLDNRRNERVWLYLRVSSMENTALMDEIRLTIDSGGQRLYSGSLSGKVTTASGESQDVSASGIPLGVSEARSLHYVTAKLEVPVTVGNAFAGASGNIKWAFYAEYKGNGGGGSGGGGSGGSGGSGSGGGTDQRDTDPERRLATIQDSDIPLGGNLYSIPEEQTPLTSLPKTGGSRETLA